MKQILITISMLFMFATIEAQVEVSMVNSEIKSISDLYNLEINNPSGNPYLVYIELELRQDNQLQYESRTNQYALVQPITIVNEQLLQPIQVKRNELNRLSGNYELNIRLIDVNTQQAIFVDRLSVSADNRVTEAGASSNKGLDFQYSGHANIYGQLSDMQGIGSFVPRQYVRAEIHPDFSVSGIPIGLDILFSTEQNAFRQSMNQVAFRFDARQFKKQMQRRLQSKIKEVEAIGDLAEVNSLDQLKQKAMDKKFPKLKEWEAQLNDTEIIEGLQQLKQLESINQVLNSQEIQTALENKKNLESREGLNPSEIEELSRLQSFISEIEKLRKKSEEIRAFASKYEQYKDLGNKISQAKKYANTDLARDPKFLKDGLQSLNVMSKPEQILNGFDAITIGTSFPYYSRLSMSSLSVNGIDVEWNPGSVYLAATYGQSARMTYNTSFTNPTLTLPQTTLATKFGYGSPSETHLHLTYINTSDKFDQLSLDNRTKPQSNRIVGTEGQLSVLGDKIKIGGELMASLLTRDNTIETSDAQEFTSSDIPLNSLFGRVNNSSSFDVAWRAFTELRVFGNATKVKGSIERIGANYYSLGSPTLLNDMLRWKAEIRQGFFRNKLSVSAFARQDNNNLDPLLTSSISFTKSYGISGTANIPRWPTMTFSFAPYAQNNEIIASSQEFNTNATLLNVTLGYPVKISSDISAYTQLSYLSQDLNSNIAEIDYNLKMYGINQSFTYKRNSLNLAANFTPNQVINQENQEVITFNGSATSQLFQKLNTSLGLQYLSITNTESRTGYFVNASYPIASYADFEMRVQKNIYNSQLDIGNFSDIVGWGGLKVRW